MNRSLRITGGGLALCATHRPPSQRCKNSKLKVFMRAPTNAHWHLTWSKPPNET